MSTNRGRAFGFGGSDANGSVDAHIEQVRARLLAIIKQSQTATDDRELARLWEDFGKIELIYPDEVDLAMKAGQKVLNSPYAPTGIVENFEMIVRANLSNSSVMATQPAGTLLGNIKKPGGMEMFSAAMMDRYQIAVHNEYAPVVFHEDEDESKPIDPSTWGQAASYLAQQVSHSKSKIRLLATWGFIEDKLSFVITRELTDAFLNNPATPKSVVNKIMEL